MRLAGRVALLLALGLVAGQAGTQQTRRQGDILISAHTIQVSRTTKFVATGKVHIEVANKAAKTFFGADASQVTVVLFAASGTALHGMDAVKSAVFDGPVKMVNSTPKTFVDKTTHKESEVMTKSVLTSDNASYDGSKGLAYATGNVRIEHSDPSVSDSPAVMNGDKATINLLHAPGSEDFDFRVESSPGVSTIEVTPKADEGAAKKK
jgi:lipopolysaccharide assembly outer membrane protein LptD (OstA)